MVAAFLGAVGVFWASSLELNLGFAARKTGV